MAILWKPRFLKNKDLLEFYRGEVQFESEMLSTRLDSFISSQAFLIIGFSTALGSLVGHYDDKLAIVFLPLLTTLGIVQSLYSLPGLRAAHAVIEQWHERQKTLLDTDPELDDYRISPGGKSGENQEGADDDQMEQGALFALKAPWIFTVTWVVFAGVAISLHLSS